MSIRITPLTDPDRNPSGYRLAWLASDAAGVPVGSAFLRMFTTAGQNHLAELTLHVHPAERRNHVGSRLLDAAVAAARKDGRRCVVAQAQADSPGDRFLSARGLRKVLTLTFARLPLAQVDSTEITKITGQPHPGYRLSCWKGTVADELADTFAASRRTLQRHPDLDGLLTDTADSNLHMRGINDALGYTPTHTTFEYQLDL